MKTQLSRASATRPATASRLDDTSGFDWDETVRAAFLGACVREGVRAALAIDALADESSPAARREIQERARQAELNAALGWLRIETCLARHGELAALAFARCLDEAIVNLRRRQQTVPIGASAGSARSSAGADLLAPSERPSQVTVKPSVAHAVAIVQRGRERLDRFWGTNDFRAA